MLQLRFGQALAAGTTRQVSHAADRAFLGLRQQVLFGRSHGWRRLLRVHMCTASSISSRHGPPIINTLHVIADGVRDSLIRRLLTKVRVELVLRRFAWLSSNRVSLLHNVLIVEQIFVTIPLIDMLLDPLIVLAKARLLQALLVRAADCCTCSLARQAEADVAARFDKGRALALNQRTTLDAFDLLRVLGSCRRMFRLLCQGVACADATFRRWC